MLTISDRGGLPNVGLDSEVLRLSVLGVRVGAVGDDDLLVRDPGIAQILRLSCTLISEAESTFVLISDAPNLVFRRVYIPEKDDRLVLQKIKVGIRVVVAGAGRQEGSRRNKVGTRTSGRACWANCRWS